MHVPAKELVSGTYRKRTIMLLAVWVLAYPGIVYGAGSYTPTYLVEHGWSAHQIFLFGGTGSIVAVPVVILVFYLSSLLGTFLGPPVIGVLFTATADHGNYGWILWCALLCTVAPSIIIGWFGMRQKGAVLEQIST